MLSTCATFANIPHILDGRFTALTVEPVSLDEIQQAARIDDAESATLLMGYVAAARAWVENDISTCLGERTLTLYIDEFPASSSLSRADTNAAHAIELRFPPVNSVTSVVYLDTDGSSQTLDTSLYRTDLTSRPPRITPAYGQIWPWTYPVTKAVTITFDAGYTAASLVPQCAKQAIMFLATKMYEECGLTESDYFVAKRLLDSIRWNGDI